MPKAAHDGCKVAQIMTDRKCVSKFSSLQQQDGCPGTTCLAHMTLTFGLAEQMFQMAHLLMMENNHANLH